LKSPSHPRASRPLHPVVSVSTGSSYGDVATDFKNPPRVKDPALLRWMHSRHPRCVLCGNPASLHHIYSRGKQGDDLPENLIALCGDGVTGHHGLIEANDVATRFSVGIYLMEKRPEVVLYMQVKLGTEEGLEWLRQKFYMALP
jgi:hypothetical protein